MAAVLDVRLIELLSARMCHDLISPVSAIGNGVELMTEFDDQMQGEALGLIGESAQAAARLLQYFRAALGSARAADGSPLGFGEARQRTLDCFGSGRITFDWPEQVEMAGRDLPHAAIKMIMNMVMAALDLLPGSGSVELRVTAADDVLHIEVVARKEGLSLGESFRRALAGTADPGELTPRTVFGYFCQVLAAANGSALNVALATDRVTLSAALKWV